MSSPKHLWSGDWERESARAAADRAAGEALPAPPPPPVPAPPRVAVPPRRIPAPPPRPESAPPRVGPTEPQPRGSFPFRRVAIFAALFVLVVWGAAIALSSNGPSTPRPPGRGPWLGMQMESVPVARVLIDGVVPGGPADRAGLGPGDVILKINGHPVASPGDVDADVADLHVGSSVQVEVQRGPLTFTTQATLARQPAGYP